MMYSRFEQFSFVISSIYRYIQKIERAEMVRYGFKGAYAQYLAALRRHPDGLTATQLCEACDLDKAAVSRVVGEMEQRGLVVRQNAGDSRYRARILLTDEGHRAADYVRERAEIAVQEVGKNLSDEDRKVFYAALESIAANLQIISKEGIPKE